MKMVIIKLDLLIVVIMVPLTLSVELDLINCGIDDGLDVTVGNVDIALYPWVGIFYYSYRGDIGETRAVSTVILIHSQFTIANAADIGPIPKHNFRKKSRVLLGENWDNVGRRVRNYVLHPEYGETYNTLALIQLKDPVRDVTIKPACPAPEILRNPVFYVMKFQEDYNDLKKQVIPVAHVPSKLCRDFYMKANLYSKKMRPPHVACAVSLDEDNPCVWDAGAALVARDVWGRWMLLGVGARGPGCGAPSRFLDMASYAAWVKISLDRFQQITISKISNHKFVLRTVGETAAKPGQQSVYQRFGACDQEEKINLIYRETIRLRTDNTQYQYMTYNMSIQQSVMYTCLTLELINASASSALSLRHYCSRNDRATDTPCYFYKGSIFSVSVHIMFSDACLFELYAWGHQKDMRLLDIQEWKWEEGTYYEDFSTRQVEYRGQSYMTEYGYEPLDLKMWVPEYGTWTTTPVPASTDEDPLKNMQNVEYKTEAEIYISTTSSTTTSTASTLETTTTLYFLWGVPRVNRTMRTRKTKAPRVPGSPEVEEEETEEEEDEEDYEYDGPKPHFFYRKNTTKIW